MNIILNILLVAHIMASVGIIVLVLMQQGKGANAGATFGGGASGSLFGASGSATFLSRSTAVLATVFFVSTLILAYYGNLGQSSSSSVFSRLPSTPAVAASAVAAPASAAASQDAAAAIPGNAPAKPVAAASK